MTKLAEAEVSERASAESASLSAARGFCSSFRDGVASLQGCPWRGDCIVEEYRGNRLNSFCLLYPVLFMSFMFSSCRYSHPCVFSFDLHHLYIVNNHISWKYCYIFLSLTLVNIFYHILFKFRLL